jgi:hypothetical protein
MFAANRSLMGFVMKQVVQSVAVLLTGLISFGCSDSHTGPRDPQTPSYSVERAHGRNGFGFNGTIVTAAGEVVRLTGGGSFDPASGNNTIPSDGTSGHANGGFSCLVDFTSTPLNGCAAGQGTHWDTVQLLEFSGFKCGGVANEKAKTATTGPGVFVANAEFYRAGDGDEASFHANMFVADHDLADDVLGVQNIWIQGVGCGTGTINFNN